LAHSPGAAKRESARVGQLLTAGEHSRDPGIRRMVRRFMKARDLVVNAA
jgi:hypothetical protein